MIKLIAGLFLLSLFAIAPAYGKDLPVNSYSCSKVEYKIDSIQEKQRHANKARKAELLKRELRDHRTLLRNCKSKKLL